MFSLLLACYDYNVMAAWFMCWRLRLWVGETLTVRTAVVWAEWMVSIQEAGRLRKNPGMASRLLSVLVLGNKSTLVKVRERL